jgi:hypothetical protein
VPTLFILEHLVEGDTTINIKDVIFSILKVLADKNVHKMI